ncbi:transcriptional regulator [Sphingomonas metalli]|uniref:Transcriptional regulator n=1 Tax=Sphingomonas metalli TaxID=1779358 RepID=A0A916WRE6_9SPHN|nr:MarR family winged helix-turn-helix transcriptional regulator [Sphingomonas metalli]GGB27384.1 transcriptional regulator [Sphingomonas metalli]
MEEALRAPQSAEPDAEIALGRLGDFVGFRLRRIQNQLSREFAQVTDRYQLRQGLFSALAIISANPGLSQIMLAREVGLDKSMAVMVVDELEQRGWAERRRSPTDRRRHALYTTEAGEAWLAEMFAALEVVEHDVLDALGEGDRKLLTAILDRVYKACFRG